MLLSLLLSVVPVLLGGLLGLAPGGLSTRLGPLRTLALSAAVTVVLLELLPSATAELGVLAIGLFALGIFGPLVAERMLERRASAGGLGVEFAFVALIGHQVLDGLQIGTALTLSEGGLAVALAIAAHSAPLIAATMLGYAHRKGPGTALRRLVLLAGATALGAVAGQLAGASWLAPAAPWIQGLLAGLLLHILGHDLAVDAPSGPLSRIADLSAAAIGVALPLVLLGQGHDHGDHGADSGHLELAPALAELALNTAPMLLLGLGIGAALQAAAPRLQEGWLSSGGRIGQAIRGALAGGPLPICSCDVLPLSAALRDRGAQATLVVAFLLATPQLGLETIALSVDLLGWKFALLRLGGALLVACLAALAVGFTVASGGAQSGPLAELLCPRMEGGFARRFVGAFDELLLHVGPWMAVGLLIAAYVEAAVPEAQLRLGAELGVDLPIVSAAALPAYLGAASAMPMAAVLWEKGLSSAAVLSLLLLGPATNAAGLAFLRAAYGWRGLAAACLGLGVGTVGVALSAAAWLPPELPRVITAPSAQGHSAVAWLAVGALGLLMLRGIWHNGVRGWMLALLELGGGPAHAHGHGHDHSHGHVHGHDHGH